ncbi:MAG: tetratricopeptide repeat protein [Chitinophagaceae bacterium]
MKRVLFLFGFLLSIQTGFSQNSDVDALFKQIATEKNENTRIDIIIDFLANTSEVDPILDMQNCQKILLQSQKNKDKITEAMALSNIAYDYRAFGNTAKSLEYNLKATALAAETGNEKLINNTELNLAHIYKDQADYSKAIPIYLSSAASAIRQKDYLIQAWTFASLGEVYEAMNIKDSALIYTQRAYELCTQYHYTDFISSVIRTLGSIQGKMGNKELAISYFNMSIKYAFSVNSSRWLNQAYFALAQYYFDTNQNDSSLVYAKKAIDIVKNTAFSNKSIKPAKLLLDIYENTNSDSAIKYLKIYKAANDSLYSAKTIQQTQAMTFENELRQQEIATEKIKAEEKRKLNIQYELIALCIVTFIILFLLLSRSIIVTEKWISFFGVLGLLVVFEFINLFIHPALVSVTHESPILMLLVLVVIASLLIPLHHKMEKWIKEKMVEKNKKIRLEAAKKTIEKLDTKTENL